MRKLKELKKFYNNGFTLIELIVILAVLSVVASIVAPRLTGFKSNAEERVCDANRKIVERIYFAFLLENNHEDSIFNQFLIENFDEVCPVGGVITYEDGKVKCSVHESGSEGEEDEGPGEEVPWL